MILTVDRAAGTWKKEEGALKPSRSPPAHWFCGDWKRIAREVKRNLRKVITIKRRARGRNEEKSWKLRPFLIQILKTWRSYLKRAGRKRTEAQTRRDAMREVRKDVIIRSHDKEVTQAQSVLKEAHWVRVAQKEYRSKFH